MVKTIFTLLDSIQFYFDALLRFGFYNSYKLVRLIKKKTEVVRWKLLKYNNENNNRHLPSC
ncbi:unnamed protein product [Brugia timori]|uniref:GIIM domain-containing protein n=1 Tax=Brugia timori TaxID=42155 RepID=A0A0R3QP78_9BILA|nr:unnamed protein product [Brugia timori]